jgi:hypothetical protein
MQAPGGHIVVARILHEDDAFMTLEVVKDNERKLDIVGGERFLTLVFVRHPKGAPSDEAETWLPWSPDK